MITVEPKLKALLYSRIKDKECCMYGSGLDCIAIVFFFFGLYTKVHGVCLPFAVWRHGCHFCEIIVVTIWLAWVSLLMRLAKKKTVARPTQELEYMFVINFVIFNFRAPPWSLKNGLSVVAECREFCRHFIVFSEVKALRRTQLWRGIFMVIPKCID